MLQNIFTTRLVQERVFNTFCSTAFRKQVCPRLRIPSVGRAVMSPSLDVPWFWKGLFLLEVAGVPLLHPAAAVVAVVDDCV